MGVPAQVVIWLVIPNTRSQFTRNISTKNALRYIVVFQYFPRMLRIFPLLSKIVNTTGVLLETAWAGAAFNLLLYMLASHVSAHFPFILILHNLKKNYPILSMISKHECEQRHGLF